MRIGAREATLSSQLALSGNRPSGFDYLRISLSFSIVAWHSIEIVYGTSAAIPFWHGPVGVFVRYLVPGFFALSGFLVAGSLERNDLPSFLTLRALRIFPALAVEVVISALIIGTFLTILPIQQYFSDPQFWSYFLNIIGDVHFSLPGVFVSSPTHLVNGQLWTIPFELECYIVISVLSLIGSGGLNRRPFVLMGLTLLYAATVIASQLIKGRMPSPYFLAGRLDVMCFIAGVSLYGARDRLPFSKLLFLSAFLLMLPLLTIPALFCLAPIPVAYVTIYIGLLNPKRIFLIRGADYSYGVYLYGYPIQQAVNVLLPWTRFYLGNLVVSITVISLFAAFSWHVIEAPILNRKKGALANVRRFTLQIPVLRQLVAVSPARVVEEAPQRLGNRQQQDNPA